MATVADSDLDSLLAVPRRFYLSLPIRLIISIAPVCPFFFLKLLPFNISQMPMEGAIVLTVLFGSFLLFSIYAAWRTWRPAITLTTKGIELNLSRFFTTDFAAWDTIEGVFVEELKSHGKLHKMAKLVVATDEGITRELVISITSLRNGEEALTIIRRVVPERKPADFSHVLERLKPHQREMMRYRDIDLTPAGIIRKGETIPWSQITFMQMEGLVIAGYGSVTIGYAGKSGEDKFVIRASVKEEYLDCIKLIFSKAQNLSVDPGIIGMLGYTVDAARKDVYAVVLLVTGFILSFVGLIVLSFYPPTLGSTWLYPLLLIPLAFVPLGWTLKLLSTRFQGGTANPSRKIIGALLFNLGPIFSAAILFSLSPASFLWLLADASALVGRMDQAEKLYVKASPALEKNADFIFTLGQFYFRKGDWNRAAEYYIQSYKKDPTNWMPDPLANIPDTLLKAGRHEEALQWCEKILREYAKNRQARSMMEKVKKKIILSLKTKKKNVKMQESTK